METSEEENIADVLMEFKTKIRNKMILENTYEELIELLNQIDKCLQKLCIHDIVEDWIDITPERSGRIFYCNKCYKTLDFE
jgi:hypothetical protein